MDLQPIIQNAAQQLRRAGEHPPTFFVQFQDQPVPIKRVLRRFPDTQTQRQRILYQEGRLLGQSFPVGVPQEIVFIFEAWVSTNLSIMRPSQDPKRRESLVGIKLDGISVNEPALRQQAECLIMHRGRKRKITGFVPLSEATTMSEPITVAGAVLLVFLTGFVDATSPTHPFAEHLREQVNRELLRLRIFREEFQA